MGFLAGKRALIVGLASDRSIAYGIAAAMHREGAELAFTYQNDRLKDRVVEMAQGFGSAITLPMDVASDAEIDTAFAGIREVWDSLDIIVHSVAFAPREELAGTFVDSTTRDGFRKMLTHVAAATPLRRNVTTDEVGNAAAFLCSDLASGITGEILYVDAGYSHVGMSFPE